MRSQNTSVTTIFSILALTSIFLGACEIAQTERDTLATTIAASIYATQTAYAPPKTDAPPMTSAPLPTHTPTSEPALLPTPTATTPPLPAILDTVPLINVVRIYNVTSEFERLDNSGQIDVLIDVITETTISYSYDPEAPTGFGPGSFQASWILEIRREFESGGNYVPYQHDSYWVAHESLRTALFRVFLPLEVGNKQYWGGEGRTTFDNARIVEQGIVETQAGVFDDCYRFEREAKPDYSGSYWICPGIGMVQGKFYFPLGLPRVETWELRGLEPKPK